MLAGKSEKQYAIGFLRGIMRPYVEAQFTIKQALGVIGVVTLSVFAIVFGGFAFQKWQKTEKAKLSGYSILGIVQSTKSPDMLKTQQLAEFLGLSNDLPQNLYAFDQKWAYRVLQSLPFMKNVSISALPPSLVSIDYTMRAPKWLLADYENIAVDEEGYIFPITPFYTPKKLPHIQLGLPPFLGSSDLQGRVGGAWNKPLQGHHFTLAKKVLQLEKSFPAHFEIVKVDVQRAFYASKDSEIVIKLKETKFDGFEKVTLQEYLLRLPQEKYEEALERFFAHIDTYQKLRGSYHLQIVDLRLDRIALVKSL